MVKTDSYVQFEAGKLTYRVVPVTEEIIRMIVSGKEIKEAQDSLIIEKKEYPEVDFSAEENAGSIIVKTVKVCAEINTASGDIIWKHADGSKWLSQKKPELTETDVIHYNTGDEEPIINRVKTVDGERNFIQNLKAEKVRTAYRGKRKSSRCTVFEYAHFIRGFYLKGRILPDLPYSVINLFMKLS